METYEELQGNDLGYSKNAKDWAIRRRVSKAAMIGYETVSETAKASVWNTLYFVFFHKIKTTKN